ncbi:hypothetical protein QFC22_003660 [Naganishia vaughanmartiniae]|uniref:Uncharacterized protein n=1 Tax=Naganishia vaughanmartiniae TaxID=1424756 RepID=A0ACC2X565_9TREE|nr:hypothetical protein QFC22_003660 [Naganishia vaughanmartiniae]
MLANYRGPVSLKDPSHANGKPVVTYLSRQEANHRKLNPDTHEELIMALKALEQEGLAEVNVEEFADADDKDDQVAKLSRTTILVGVHGNGLTNLIWMTPDTYGRSAVYEIQQPGMFTDDYAILSKALGIEHWIIGGRDENLEYCQRSTCGIYGTSEGIDPGHWSFTLRVPELVKRVRNHLMSLP